MRNPQVIKRELERLTDLGILVGTYQTIASATMQRIRDSVLSNRAFHLGLNKIFRAVKRAHQKELAKLHLERVSVKDLFSSRSSLGSKVAYVFLSANTGLYGDVVTKTFRFFQEAVKGRAIDVVVVGKIGKALMDEEKKNGTYQYFDFPDNRMDLTRLKDIATHLSQYQQIAVVHASFKNFLAQEPVVTNVTGDIPGEETARGEVRYLFEPSLNAIIAFFQTEIFASLFEQTFNESRLAKLAGRMMLLERSNQNIEISVRRARFQEGRLRHQLTNKKQVNSLAGIPLWG